MKKKIATQKPSKSIKSLATPQRLLVPVDFSEASLRLALCNQSGG